MRARRFSLVVVAALLLTLGLSALGQAEQVLFRATDPVGDDNGPGTYVYPLNPVFLPGSFDITAFEAVDAGAEVVFRVTLAGRIENPWGAPNGFSVQMVQIYIDQGPGGYTDTLPGVNATFAPEHAWNKAILAEGGWGNEVEDLMAALVAPDVAANVLVAKQGVHVRGQTIVIPVAKSWLAEPRPGWGYQLLLLGQEGARDGMDGIKVRRILREEEEWRFGGSDESGYHTNIIDLLLPPGASQAAILSAHEPAAGRFVVIPMLYGN